MVRHTQELTLMRAFGSRKHRPREFGECLFGAPDSARRRSGGVSDQVRVTSTHKCLHTGIVATPQTGRRECHVRI